MNNDNTKPVVWVIQEGQNDYSPAEDYGVVQFVTTSDMRSTSGSSQSAYAIRDIKSFKEKYKPGIDYIVPVGNPIVVSLIVMSLPDGNHNFLKWDGRRANYVPFSLNRDMVA